MNKPNYEVKLMPQLEKACGLDLHKDKIVGFISSKEGDLQELREFRTFSYDLGNTDLEAWPKRVKLYPIGYKTYRKARDHGHCNFCMSKFSVLILDCLTEGWATEDDYRWICKDCFEDFKDYFKWQVVI